MSIESTRQPPILRSFIQSELFDPQLLSDLIPSLAGDQSSTVVMNTLRYHPDFVAEQKICTAYKIFQERQANKTLQQLASRELKDTESLQRCFEENNPYLLKKLRISQEKFCDVALRLAVKCSWDALRLIFQQSRSQEDLNFLLGMTQVLQRELYQNHLDPHFHELQHQAFFANYRFASFIAEATRFNCLKILHMFIDSPQAREATCDRKGRFDRKGHKEYVIRTSFLTEISNKFAERDPELKEKVDLEIARRAQFWTRAVFSISPTQKRASVPNMIPYDLPGCCVS